MKRETWEGIWLLGQGLVVFGTTCVCMEPTNLVGWLILTVGTFIVLCDEDEDELNDR